MGFAVGSRSLVSLHYPKSVAQAVCWFETTELDVKESIIPSWKGSTARNPAKSEGAKNQRGGRSGYFPGRENSGYRGETRG